MTPFTILFIAIKGTANESTLNTNVKSFAFENNNSFQKEAPKNKTQNEIRLKSTNNTNVVENNFNNSSLFSLCSATYFTIPLNIPKVENDWIIGIIFLKSPMKATPVGPNFSATIRWDIKPNSVLIAIPPEFKDVIFNNKLSFMNAGILN